MPAAEAPSTDRPTSCVADDDDARDLEHVAQPDPGPLRVPDEPATDLVADAGDRHVLLEHRQGQQLVPGQRRLTLHETVDPQGPGGDVHARDQERGVDAVEILIRNDDRGQAGRRRRKVGPGGEGWHGLRGDRQLRGGDRRRPRTGEQASAAETHDERGQADGAGAQQERAARRVRGCDDAAPSSDPRRPGEEPRQGLHPEPDRHRGLGRHGGRIGQRIAEGGREAEHPERDETRRRDGEATDREDAEDRPERQRREDHDDLEGHLVVRPEERHHQVLGARRLQVDDDLADRRDEGGRARQQRGDQLRRSEGHGRGGHASGRGIDPRRRRTCGNGRAERRCGGAHGVMVHRTRDIRVSCPATVTGRVASGPSTGRRAPRRRAASRTPRSGRRR